MRRAIWLVLTVLAATRAEAQVTVSVDPGADVHPISPLIYGVNFPSAAQLSEGHLAYARWGGNSTSRYNYQLDLQNTGSDWYFENVPGCWGSAAGCNPAPADPQEQSGANAFLQQASSAGATALLTVSVIGWVAKGPPTYNHPFDCGCTAAGQGDYDAWDTSCGSGRDGPGEKTNPPQWGNWIAGACDPSNTSMPVDAGWDAQWASYLVGKYGPSEGLRVYELDNEPSLWNDTHHDIHPQPLSYDEEWSRMRDAAIALLNADPTAEIAGPAEWGWPNYFCSAQDLASQYCSASAPDRAAHGGEELTAWLLDQFHQYDQQTGTRLLHYLDLHYYPQGGSPPDNLRSLWDPSYVDPSWINDTIRLIPRMHDWVNQHYPGTKLSISEYDWYDHDSANGAIAYAEGLGIFGREGLDAATAWSPPATNQIAFAAFRLFRNYDGQGSGFESTSVRASVTGSGVQAFAASGSSRLTVALVNESSSTVSAAVSLGSFAGTGAHWFSNQGTAAISAMGALAVSGGSVSLSLPPSSINMLVVDGSGGTTTTTSSSSGSTGSSTTTGSSSTGGTSGTSTSGSGSSSGTSTTGSISGSTSGGTAGASGGCTGSSGGVKGSSCSSASGAALLPLLVLGLALRKRRR